MTIIENIQYGKNSVNQILDLYLPESKNFDVFVNFHGGGIEAGDKKDDVFLIEQLVNSGFAVVSANYRMYPTAHFPEFLEDAAMAVAWVKKNIFQYGNTEKISVGGHSAGAYLSAMLAYNPEYLGAHNIKTTDIAGYVINSAQMTTHFNVLRERGIDNRRLISDEAAPVFHISENTDFPNVFIIYSDNDMPCRPEQNKMFLKTLEIFECPESKVKSMVFEGFDHCGYMNEQSFADAVINYLNDVAKGD